MPALPQKRLHLPAWPVQLIVLCVLLIIGAPPIAWWQMNRNPVVHIPTPVLPSPNAFDYYVKAANVVPRMELISLPTLTTAQRASLLAMRPEVMRLMVQGMQFPCLAPPIRNFGTLAPYLSKYRNLARYFDGLAQISAAQGDWAGAMEDSQLSLRFGADTMHGSCVIGALVGIACQAIGRREACATVAHLSPREARKALAMMEDIDAREVPCSHVLLEEKWSVEASIVAVFRMPNWRQQLVPDDNKDENKPEKIHLRARVLLLNKRQSLAHFAAYFDACIAISQTPFARRKPNPPIPDDIICQDTAIVGEKVWVKMLANATGNRLLTVQLALQAYYGEHGAYPPTLAALVTADYLHKLPDDPFALSGSFRYRCKGNGYLLYSLGPEGVDDGGKPIMDSKDPTKPATGLQVESKGDIVAGVNRL